MTWYQKEIVLPSSRRGFLLITEQVIDKIPEIQEYKSGLLHLFIKHTSASLTINENADPTVREDMESHFNRMVPENVPYYKHTFEGPDEGAAIPYADQVVGAGEIVDGIDDEIAIGSVGDGDAGPHEVLNLHPETVV